MFRELTSSSNRCTSGPQLHQQKKRRKRLSFILRLLIAATVIGGDSVNGDYSTDDVLYETPDIPDPCNVCPCPPGAAGGSPGGGSPGGGFPGGSFPGGSFPGGGFLGGAFLRGPIGLLGAGRPSYGPQAYTRNPVNLHMGAVTESAVDLAINGPTFSWSHRRSYNSAVRTSVKTRNGNRWVGGDSDLRINNEDDIRYHLYASASSKRTFDYDSMTGVFTAPGDSHLTLEGVAGSRLKLTDENTGDIWYFNDYTVTNTAQRGCLLTRTHRDWEAEAVPGINYTIDSNGNLTSLTTANGQDYTVTYTYSSDKITNITVKEGATELMKADYTYKTGSPSDIGTTDDLVQVKISKRNTGNTGWIERYTQYRYDSASRLTHVFESDAIQRIIADDVGATVPIGDPDDILAVANDYTTEDSGSEIQDFASRSFTYYTTNENASGINTLWDITSEDLKTKYGGTAFIDIGDETGLVKSETIRGSGSSCCGGGSSGEATHEYYYLKRSGSVTDANDVERLVVEDTAGSDSNPHHRTIYGMNESGRLLRKVFINNPITSSSYWCESWTLETTAGKEGRIFEHRSPAAHDVESNSDTAKFLDPTAGTNDATTLNGGAGVITQYAYNSDGYLTDTTVSNGTSGAANYASAIDYVGGSDADKKHRITKVYTYPSQTGTRTAGKAISYAYTYHTNDQVKTIVTTLPSVSSSQNGPGSSSTTNYYDESNRLRWDLTAEGAVNYYSYDPETGGLALVVKDVNTFATLPTEITTTGSGNWIAWSGSAPLSRTTSDTAYALIEKIEYDELGRVTKRINPHGEPGEHESSEHYTVYETDKTVVYLYWDGTNATLPVEVTEFDGGGTITETYSVFPSEVNGSGGEPPAAVGTHSQGKYSAWTRFTYDDVNGKLTQTDRYHDIPSSGVGTLSTNFHKTAFGYDELGRRDIVVNVVSGTTTTSSVEQVTKTTYDKLGRVQEIERGVSGTSHNMGSSYATLPTLETVSYNEWDSGNNNDGDSFLTAQIRYHGTGATANTGSRLHRTFRGHLRGVEPFHTYSISGTSHTSLGPYTHHDIDWQGRITVTATYSTEPTWTTSYSAHAESTSTNRLSLSRNKLDDLGRVYRTEVETISSSGTTGGGRFETNFYRDREGNLVAEQSTNSAATEYVYDNLGRMYQERTVSDLETTKFTSGAYNYRAPLPNTGGSVSGGDDGVLAFTHTDFDDAGNIVKQFNHDMNHADTNGMSGSATTSFVRAAVYNWYDDASRVDKTVNFGSGKGAAAANVWEYNFKPSYVYSTPPTTTNDYRLLTTYAYNGDSGRLEKVTDAAGKISKMFYDDLGRVTYVADNWVNFSTPDTGTGDATDKSKDQVTKNEYDGLSNVIAITALGGATGTSDDQETTYDFEDAYDASLVTRTTYPDSSGSSDDVEMTYHLDGQLDSRTDQNGTVFDYDYTDWRGLERKKATTLGTGVDGYVQSIGRTYDSRRRLDKLTSYSTATGSTIRNELAYAYQDSWNKVYVEYQDHNGAADTTEPTTSPHVAYIYDETLGSSIFTNGLRLKSMVHPSGNTTDFYFDSTYNDRLHRIDRIRTDRRTGTAEDIVKYEYTGASRVVEVEYQTSTKVHLKYDPGDGDGRYEKLDRFGRVMYQRWGTAGITRDRFAYTYDDSGNVLTRDFPKYVYNGNDRDHVYTYDGLNRLETFGEGELSGVSLTGTHTSDQEWTLDSLGNWTNLIEKAAGTTTLDQDRTHNDANELTKFGTSTNYLAHDAAGNMTEVPQPGSWSSSYDLIYDAWNRLVEVKDGVTTVAEYEYDGLHRRTVKTVGSDVKHFYYNTSWQVVEVRDASETGTTVEEYVWHPYYVDALAVRYWDSDEDGDYASTDETHYFTHDANQNITAALQHGSAVKERYLYKPYGGVEVVTASFGAQSGSVIDNPHFFTGRRLDDETGLYHFRNRFYHAELGRFVSRDPIGYVDEMNLFQYVGGAPTGFVDPSGLSPNIGAAITIQVSQGWTIAQIADFYAISLAAAAIVYNKEKIAQEAASIVKRLQAAAKGNGPCAKAKWALSKARKSIRGFEKVIAEHRGKIKDPVPNMSKWRPQFTKEQNIAMAINDWNNHINTAKTNIKYAKAAVKTLEQLVHIACWKYYNPCTWW